MHYVTGKIIKELRERKKLTQRQLADLMQISDKTVSKWETERGLPDIGLMESLAKNLDVSVAELLSGEYRINLNRSANMKKVKFYVCPICGNVIHAIGEGNYTCCGITLPPLQVEEDNKEHHISVEMVDNEYYITVEHPMLKTHYISFLAYVTSDTIQFKKLYSEQNAEGRFARRGHGILYAYCNQHGLFQMKV